MVTILCYHEIINPDRITISNPFSIRHKKFENHVRIVKELGFESFKLGDVLGQISERKSDLTGKVVFTFDDGHISNYIFATEILTKYAFKGTFFITTSHIGSGSEWMNAAQIREIAAMGMEVGSHTHTHAYLDELSRDHVLMELSKSKEILQQIVGHEVRFLSCPGGRFNRGLKEMSRKVGYRLVCTSVPGINRRISNTPVPFLERYVLKNKITDANFLRLVTQQNNLLIDKSVYYLKAALRKLMGNQMYHYCWKKLRIRG